MKIKVISLTSATHRRKNIEQQFGRLETGFDFFDALRPEDSLAHIEGYDEHEFHLNCGRAATDTEIACYASHLSLWRQCAAEGEPYLILEDDAKLHDNFAAGLLVTSCRIRQLGFIRVSLPDLKTSIVVDRLGPFDLHYCRRAPLLALGYALSPGVAAQLAALGGIVEEPVDKYLQRFWRFQRPVFAIVPPFVTLSALASDSEIGERTRPPTEAHVWIQRAMRKTRNAVSRTLYNVSFMSDMERQLRRGRRSPGDTTVSPHC